MLAPPGPQFANRSAAQAFHAGLRQRLAALPGVTAAGAISQLPLTGQGPLQPYAYDAETARNWEQLSADSFSVTPGYFSAVRATWLAGPDLTPDDIAGSRRVIVIDDSLADRAFGGAGRAVGRLLQLEPEARPESFFEVVGVVAHMRYHDLRRAQLSQNLSPRPVQDVQRGPSRGGRDRRARRGDAHDHRRGQTQAPRSRTSGCSPTSSTTRSGRCGWRCGS